MTKQEREKRFDEQFPLEYFVNTEFPYNYKETPMEWKLLDWQDRETKKAQSRKEYFKAFIQSEIDLALANRNKEIVVIVEKLYKDTTKTCFYKMCNSCNSEESCGCEEYNNALDEIINLITKDNE